MHTKLLLFDFQICYMLTGDAYSSTVPIFNPFRFYICLWYNNERISIVISGCTPWSLVILLPQTLHYTYIIHNTIIMQYIIYSNYQFLCKSINNFWQCINGFGDIGHDCINKGAKTLIGSYEHPNEILCKIEVANFYGTIESWDQRFKMTC